MVTGEMTSSQENLRNTEKSIQRAVHMDEPEPRSIQIVGWCPAMMADAARFHVDHGASIIDINMGCPAKKVCKKLAGSALLSDPALVERILQKVVSATDVPVTLKIRTGVDANHRNGVEIAKIAEQCGIALLAVHGRTRDQRYTGNAEFETIKHIKSAVSIPVVANGDIASAEFAKKVIKYTACDGVMIGRAAHGAPWFPGQVAHYLKTGHRLPSPNVFEQGKIVLDHIQGLYEFYGEYKGVRVARKHIRWYLSRLPNAEVDKRHFNRIEDGENQLSAIQSYYSALQMFSKAA